MAQVGAAAPDTNSIGLHPPPTDAMLASMNKPVAPDDIQAAAQAILLQERSGTVCTLTLNRPHARNSLSEATLTALAQALSDISSDRSVRCIVLAANGPAFSAGHDLKELTARRSDADGGRAYFKQIMQACSAVMQMVVHLPQPVIAAVEGPASAAGCQLVASCDLAVASRTAKFATPGVDIGLFCSTPMVALSRNVSAKHAMEMLLTGEMLPAEDAVRIGLVNRVVEPGRAVNEARALANRIASKPAGVVKLGKEAFYRQREMSLADAYSYTAEVMAENMMAADAEEGICAFIDKRSPVWRT
jgi:enoyl-CoA hydratase/carnithine racemase